MRQSHLLGLGHHLLSLASEVCLRPPLTLPREAIILDTQADVCGPALVRAGALCDHVAVIRPRHSPRRRYFDIGTAFQRSSRTALTGLISPFGNRAVASRHLVRAWLASRESRSRSRICPVAKYSMLSVLRIGRYLSYCASTIRETLVGLVS